ncbi:XTP/dITP diphosphatase [Candidatus Bathyarchaeota archaeon]|nr:MAG: XTP/dITP diphosphatase [Candidatus Bathyarchaeota archaeon]RLI11546.1 MAG: non-canonical purine NTP pyrophosphatase, RdgB/HAM1 family [Candidatus Bathyarchaeota archaeon]HDN05922.1 XTP/dITP diphosphatase [Candidatus Bathyarchaeota archaeon]
MSFRLKGKFIFFATNNINKFNEARVLLADYGISVGMLRVKSLEIQSESLEEIAKTSVTEAFKRCHLPLIVEDAGLFIKALNGFPGPYASYVYKTIGNKGVLKLMENVEDREAKFQSAIAYYAEGLKSPICFKGEAVGEVTKVERKGKGKSGFGFDPIFKPVGSDKTFAEMTTAEKNRYSHRAKALRKFAEWYKHQQ